MAYPRQEADNLLRELTKKSMAAANINVFIEEMMKQFGGPGGLAREMRLLYDDAPPSVKARIADGLVTLMLKTSDAGNPEDWLEPQDLEALARNEIKKLLLEEDGRRLDEEIG